MDTILLRFIVIVLVTMIPLVASQKKTDSIANISAVPLYNINKNTLQETMKTYINNYPNLKALKIVESLTNETYVTIFKDKDKIFYNKELPKSINKLSFYKSISKYENEEVGTVFAYFVKSSELILTQEEKNWINKNSTIKVIKFFDEPPLTINTSPKTGYIYELFEYIAASSGLKIEYIDNFTSFGSMLEGLEKGKADVLPTFTTSIDLGKDSNIVASKSILKTPFVIVGKANDNEVEVIDDLFGKKVAVVKGYAQDKYLSKFQKIIKVYVKNNEEGFSTIRSGKAQYYVNNRANTEYVLNTSFATDLRIVYELSYEHFPPLSISFAMNKNKKIMVSILQKALEQMPYKEIKNIQDKWIIQKNGQKRNKINLTQKEKEWIQKHQKIRVHNEKTWAPYNFYEKGRARGLSIDFIKELVSRVGIDIDIDFITGPTWDEFMTMSKNKEIDVMLNIVKSPTREKFLNFTEPYSELIQSLYIKKGMTPITKIEELFGKTFAVPKGFYYEEQLKGFPQIKLLKVNNTLECIQAISFGKADAMLDLNAVVNYYKNKHHINDVVLGGTLGWEGGSLPISIGIRKDWPELVSILNKVLSSLTDKELDAIENKWLFSNNNNKDISLNKEEKDWIENNVIKIGVEQWAPVIFSTNGTDIDGISGDILKLIIKRTGLQTEVVNDIWDTLLNRFKNKEIDILPATYKTAQRMKYGLFSSEYFNMLDYIYIQEDNNAIKTMQDLNGKKIAILKGSGTIDKVRDRFPKIQIVETINLSDSVDKVLNGEVDALFDAQIAVEYNIQENLITGLKGLPQNTFKTTSIHVFSRDDQPILQSIIQKALNSITKKEINEIKSNWIVNSNSENRNFHIQNEKQELNLSDLLPLKEMIIGLLIFLVIFYLIWKYQLKGNDKEFALKGTLFVIIGSFLFIASLITILTINNLEKAQKSEIQESLKTVLHSSYKTIKLWTASKYRRLDIVLENKDIPKYLKDVNENNNLEKLQTHFQTYERVFEDSRYYLLSKDFETLSSSIQIPKDSKIIKDIKKVIKGSTNAVRWLSIPNKVDDRIQKNMLVIKAIKYNKTEVVGYLVMEVNPQKEFTRILQNGQLGKSGETYAFNENLNLISNSRFDEQLKKSKLLDKDKSSFLNIKVKSSDNKPTLLAKNALEKSSGINTDGYKDYRDIMVYGAWVWDDEIKIGFATEIDKNEAMGAFNNMKNTIYIIVFSIILFTVFLTLLVGWISKKSKLSLEKSNEELNKLLNSFDENVIASRSDLSGKITYASKAFANITGYSVEELIGKPHSTVRHPDMPKETFGDLWKTIKSGNIWKGEVKNKNKSGGFYWVDVVIEPVYDLSGKIVGYSAIRHDITSKKEVEKLSTNLEIKVEERTVQLQVEQQKFESMVSNVPGAIYRVVNDSAWPIIYMSDEILNITGYPASDFIDNKIVTFSTIMYPDDVEPIGKSIVEQFAKGNKFVVEYRVIKKSGDIVWVRSEGQSVKSENGEDWIDGVLVDITEMVKSKKEVEESAIRFSLLANNISQLAWMADEEGNIFWYNERWYNYTGTTLEEMKGWGWKKVHHPDHIDRVIEKISNCFEKGIEWEDSFPLKSKDGEFRWFLSRATPVKDDDGNIIRWFGTNTDITENKQLSDEIEQIHKHTKDSIEYAALIQSALIPSDDIFSKYFNDFFTIWQPKDIVGGDIYLFEELRSKDECLLMVIDCTGHGVPGAFVSMLVKAIERQVVAKIESDTEIEVSPAWILSYFNKTMKKLLKQESADSISNAGFDGAILYYNRKENYIKYAGAETPLFYIQNDELNMFKGNRHSIGYKKSDMLYEFDEFKIDIDTDTKLYITTDGYLDQNGGEKGFPFGKRKFKELISQNSNLDFEIQKEILFSKMEEYMKDEERNDDTTVVGIEVLARSTNLLGNGI